MKHSGIRLPAVLALLLAGATACSGGSSSTPAGHPSVTASGSTTPGALPAGATLPDPCAVVTPAQVATAIGGTAGAGKPSTLSAPLAGKSCTWSTPTAPIHVLVISVRSDSTITAVGESAASLFAQDISTLSATQLLVQVAGLGDSGYVGYTQGSDNAHVLKRDVVMDVVGLYGNDTTPAAQARFLAFVKAAVAKL